MNCIVLYGCTCREVGGSLPGTLVDTRLIVCCVLANQLYRMPYLQIPLNPNKGFKLVNMQLNARFPCEIRLTYKGKECTLASTRYCIVDRILTKALNHYCTVPLKFSEVLKAGLLD